MIQLYTGDLYLHPSEGELRKAAAAHQRLCRLVGGLQDIVKVSFLVQTPKAQALAESKGWIVGPGDIARSPVEHRKALLGHVESMRKQPAFQVRSQQTTIAPPKRRIPVTAEARTVAAPGRTPARPLPRTTPAHVPPTRVSGRAPLARVPTARSGPAQRAGKFLTKHKGRLGMVAGASALGYGAYRMLRGRGQQAQGVRR